MDNLIKSHSMPVFYAGIFHRQFCFEKKPSENPVFIHCRNTDNGLNQNPHLTKL